MSKLLVEGGSNKNIGGGQMVSVTDEYMGVSQLLGARAWASPPKSTTMVETTTRVFANTLMTIFNVRIKHQITFTFFCVSNELRTELWGKYINKLGLVTINLILIVNFWKVND